MRIPLKVIPQEIIYAYNLATLVDNQGWIYMRIENGMYGLKQSGIIDNQELVKHMAPFGYHPTQHTPRLWVHENRNTIFSLVVDDFCVQYSLMEDSENFKIPSEQNISLQSIWKRQSILESSYIGTMYTETSHRQFRIMCARICTDFNTF